MLSYRRTAIFGSIIQLIVTAMFNQILNTTDALLYGVNTTRLNREFIIRFRELDDNGNLKRARLITGRQFVAMLAEKKETLCKLVDKLNGLREDRLYRKLRGTGQFEFVWR